MAQLLSLFLTFNCCLELPQSEVPEIGTYIYEVAFAEWDGKTMSDEIGGCIGGPTIINFENQSIELC